jgi:hypothetical protein
MFEALDNRLSGCISLFMITVISIWYIKPRILFSYDNPDEVRTKTLQIGSFEVNMFGMCAVIIAIFIYYVCALIQYS